MSILKKNLLPNEQVIDRIPLIKYEGDSFDCALTNQRILLYQTEKNSIKEINLKSIKKFSLEKEWYDEFFLAAIIVLILGLIWAISGFIYQFIDDPTIIGPIRAIRALLYPGIVFICLGFGALIVFHIRMKIHILIQTPQQNFQLFAKQHSLNEFIKGYEYITSGDVIFPERQMPEFLDKERLSEDALATFTDIKVKLTFKNCKAQKLSISLRFSISFTENFINLTSNALQKLKNNPIHLNISKKKEIPLISEENLCNLPEIANDLQVNWLFLTNFNFPLQKLTQQKYHFHTGHVGFDSLLLRVESSNGDIALELSKPRLLSNAPAPEILEIAKRVINYELNQNRVSE